MAKKTAPPLKEELAQANQDAQPLEEAAPPQEDAPAPPAEEAPGPSEVELWQDRYMRALADAENARKRAERDRKEAEQYGGSRLARDLLPVHDNLVRALETVSEEQRGQMAALIEGIDLTLRELNNVMAKHGIVAVSPAVGDAFDAQIHEAMFEAPVPGTEAGKIIQIMAQGFMLHERLLRPAQVGVSAGAPPS